jgi:hypothetical protein
VISEEAMRLLGGQGRPGGAVIGLGLTSEAPLPDDV